MNQNGIWMFNLSKTDSTRALNYSVSFTEAILWAFISQNTQKLI